LTHLLPSISSDILTCLQFGSRVGGRKLGGHGARSALPIATDVDEMLGCDAERMTKRLKEGICHLRYPPNV
jgi:hypothetical protein